MCVGEGVNSEVRGEVVRGGRRLVEKRRAPFEC